MVSMCPSGPLHSAAMKLTLFVAALVLALAHGTTISAAQFIELL